MALRRVIAGCKVKTGRLDIVFYPVGNLAVCARADDKEDVVDNMLWKTAGKLVPYAGEVVVPESHDAVRRQLSFYDSHFAITSSTICAR